MSHPQSMSKVEFVALMAMMFATIAFSIDAMLPALPEIGRELTPHDLNRAQLILTAFVLGMGLGTFFTGPLSDRFGRKPIILAGSILYIVAAAAAWAAPTLEIVLLARVVQGIGAAGPRIVSLAIIRDLYSGREMARLMSVAMMIFTLVPAVAPLFGSWIIGFAGWRAIFAAFILFSVLSCGWLMLRLAEPLAVADRRPLHMRALWSSTVEILTHPSVRIAIMVQTLCFAMLFTMLTMVQQIYDITFDRAESFPVWFGLVALISASGSLLNAALVMRLGMRRLVVATLGAQIGLSGVMLVLFSLGLPDGLAFGLFVLWQTTLFFQAGMTIGNLNAIAMEPMGHIAGTTASVVGAVATIAGVSLAIPVGLMFDGTPRPLAAGILVEAILALALMRLLERTEARAPV